MITTTEAPAVSNTGQATLAAVEALYAAFDELDTEAALACFHDARRTPGITRLRRRPPGCVGSMP